MDRPSSHSHLPPDTPYRSVPQHYHPTNHTRWLARNAVPQPDHPLPRPPSNEPPPPTAEPYTRKGHFPFLSLPGETRNKIYALIASPASLRAGQSPKLAATLLHKARSPKPIDFEDYVRLDRLYLHPVAEVCKQLRREYVSEYFACNSFLLEMNVCAIRKPHANCREEHHPGHWEGRIKVPAKAARYVAFLATSHLNDPPFLRWQAYQLNMWTDHARRPSYVPQLVVGGVVLHDSWLAREEGTARFYQKTVVLVSDRPTKKEKARAREMVENMVQQLGSEDMVEQMQRIAAGERSWSIEIGSEVKEPAGS